MTPMGFDPYDSPEDGVPSDSSVETAKVEESVEALRVEVTTTLSDRDRHILEFERQWWKYAGAKEQAIRDLFELSGTRYYQILNGLIDGPAALAYDPMLIKRLRRMRGERQRARSERRLAR
jgi:hypothetical protein